MTDARVHADAGCRLASHSGSAQRSTGRPHQVLARRHHALYTDGLVETRTRSFDQGILALRSVLPCGPRQLDTACDRLISALAERFEDDVTVVLVRIPTTGTGPPDLP
jgi:serine/threonine protein phosphatase PrpC